MKRILLFAALLLSFGVSSCQCSSKPEIGPVEGQSVSAVFPVVDLPLV